MPIFAYRCDSCGFEKDVLQKRSDPPLDTCPGCSCQTFRKRLTAPAFQLKGSGWYVTDFRDNGKGKPKPGESGDAAGAGASDSSAGADAKTPAVADGGTAKSAEPASPAPAAAPAAASAASSSQVQPG